MPNVITDWEQTDQADGAEHSGQPEPDPTTWLVVRNTFLDLEDCWAKSVQECQEMSRAKRGSPGVTTVVTVCQGVLCWLLRVVFLWFCKLAFRIFSRGYRHGLWSHLSLSLRHHPQHYHERFLFVIPDIVIPWPWVVGAHVVRYHYPQQDPHL